MIWRDDDVGQATRVADLLAIDDLFQRYDTPHTIAVMAAGMDKRPDLVEAIIERGMRVELHCWEHVDLRREGREDLPRAVAMLENLFDRTPRILYPPWNRSNADVEAAAAACGLRVSTSKVSIEQYIRAGGDVAEAVVNFHHWYIPEALKLEQALRIAAARK